MVSLLRLPPMSPFYPLPALCPHVPHLPPTTHPPERAHTHRPGCPPRLLCRRAQRSHPPNPPPRRRRAQGDPFRQRLYLGGPQCVHRRQWRYHHGTMVRLLALRSPFAFTSFSPPPFSKDRWNVMGTIAHTRGPLVFSSLRRPSPTDDVVLFRATGVPILLPERPSPRTSP
jgi:hypothetical protein